MAFCFVTFSSFPAAAQNVSQETLSWQADQVTDLQTNASVSMKCIFKTIGDGQVEWIQKNGTLKTTYNVTTAQGSWSNISQPGTITYTLARNGKTFKMILERSGPDITVTLDFSKAGEFTAVRRFRIVSVE